MTATTYHRDEALREARARYFEDNAFGEDGGYGARWAKVKIGALPIWFPNTAARVKALHYHDLHHVVTGYETNLIGEAEIGSWEVASGCADKYVAWYLNLSAMNLGMYLSPSRVFCAFVRGRRSSNLYAEVYSEQLLERSVGDMRDALRLNEVARDLPSASSAERRAFAGWLAVAGLVGLNNLIMLVGPLALVGYLAWRIFG